MDLKVMFDTLLRRQFSPVLNRFIPALLKFSCSDSAVAQTLPKLKTLTGRDCYRSELINFQGNFVENLFVNKFEERILEYPEIDTLEEVEEIYKHFSLAQRLITALSESKELATVDLGPRNAVTTVKNYELVGFQQPRIKNGFGYLKSEYTLLQEALALDPSLSKTVSELEEFGVDIVNSFGSEVQKEKYLPKLISGEITASFANIEKGNFVSFEPDSMSTSAILSSDSQSYVISGTKIWVYNAQNANLFILLANVKSNSGAENEVKPTLFLIDKDVPGIEIQEPIETVGMKGLKISNVNFNNVVVPESSVLGGVSEGVSIIQKVLTQGKLSNGGYCLPIMRKFINRAVQHCIYNEFFRQDKHENVYFRVKIGRMISRLYAVESMTYLLTGRLDTHKNADVFLESLIVKIFASEGLQFIVQEALEILGPEFFTNEANLVELARESQFYSACDDSNDCLRVILSTAGLKHAIKRKNERSFLEMISESFTKQNFMSYINPEDENIQEKGILKGYLHQMFSEESCVLEDSVFILHKCTKYLIAVYKESVFERYQELKHLADIAINIYATLATLARASRAYCIGVKFQEVDRGCAETEARILGLRIAQARDCIMTPRKINPNLRKIGSQLTTCKYSELYPVLKNLTVQS